MNAVNTLPTSAQMMPEVMPPISAARNSTLVLGMNTYMKVKTTVTITYGRILPPRPRSRPAAQYHRPTARTDCVRRSLSSPSATASRMGPKIMHAQIFGEAAHETPRPIDAPHEIEAGFDLLNRRDDGVDEEDQADRAQQIAAHIDDELHDAFRQLRRRASQRREEFVENESQIAARAEALQDREAEDQQRHDRQQRGVGQAHGPHADLAAQPIADQRGGIAHHAQERDPREDPCCATS